MTTQDIYAWAQMGLQIVIGGGIVVGVSRYFHLLRRAIESQKATIEAQAEQMKAQSTVLQDFERHSKIMQQVIDFFDPEALLLREQAYRARVDRDAAETLQQSITKALEQSTRDTIPVVFGATKLISDMMPFLDLKRRQALIKASGLPSLIQEMYLKDERTMPHILVPDKQSLEQYQEDALPQNFVGEPQ